MFVEQVITYKHRHFINLGVCLTWDNRAVLDAHPSAVMLETPDWLSVAPTFCGPSDYYSRKKARELGIRRCLVGNLYAINWKTLEAIEMPDRVTPRDHKSHKWIKSFVMKLLNGDEKGLVPLQIPQKTIIEAIKCVLLEDEIPF